MFCAYCEDHPAGLLPPDTLTAIHQAAGSARKKHRYWNTFKGFFAELDEGSPPGSPHGFNAFNGGLFAADSEIDQLLLPDKLFTHRLHYDVRGKTSREMSGIFGFHVYDFSEELDVDALGAIFEQSLKDVPAKETLVRGKGAVDVSDRVSKGVYYTRKEITDFMVRRAMNAILDGLRNEAAEFAKKGSISRKRRRKGRRALSATEKREKLFLQGMMEHLRELKFHDPACGSGAFLIEALDLFREEYNAVNRALEPLLGTKPLFGLNRLVLRNNLHGWDILEESTEVAKLSIWLRTAAKNEPLEDLGDTIVTRDSLRADESSQFDMIVSNPPWGADLEGWSDQELVERFPECGEEKDSYAAFLILAHQLLRDNGVVSYIMPNSWLTTRGYESFRRWILDAFDILEIVNVWKVFGDVNHDACIVVLRKRARRAQDASETRRKPKTHVRCLARGGSESEKCTRLAEERWNYSFTANPNAWKKEPYARFETMYETRLVRELDRIAARCQALSKCCQVTVGIQVYHIRKVSRQTIEQRAFHSDRKRGVDWHPFITGNEVQRYFEVPSDTAYLKYSEQLCDKRELNHYKLPRVLVQQIFWNRLAASVSHPKQPFLYLNTLFSLTQPTDEFSLEYLAAILNSRLMSACYERWTNRLFGDKFPKVSKIDLARIPIPTPTRAIRRRLALLGRNLNQEWQRCKDDVTSFHDYLRVLDPSEALVASLAAPWSVSREGALAAVAECGVELSQAKLRQFTTRWRAATTKLNARWATIIDSEEEVDRLVTKAYGISAAVEADLIVRAPPVQLDDVLLPR